ncbi:hypothetical protein BDR04DRAFT_1089984 [Suillus decipiens]|nr:hypothetical protein BDR04DRAFT_1089984 [Suillus decipiens]
MPEQHAQISYFQDGPSWEHSERHLFLSVLNISFSSELHDTMLERERMSAIEQEWILWIEQEICRTLMLKLELA